MHVCSDGDGFLTKSELSLFLASFLRFLLGCAFSSASTRKYGTTTKIINDTCSVICNDIFRNDIIAKIDFQYFGDWYNEGGFKIIPWLELIDLSKWVRITTQIGMNGQQSLSESFHQSGGVRNMNLLTRSKSNIVQDNDKPYGYAADDNESSDSDSHDDYDKVAPSTGYVSYSTSSSGNSSPEPFTLTLLYRANSRYNIKITPATVNKIHDLANVSGIANLTADDISENILRIADKNDMLLDCKTFFRFLERIKPDRRKLHTSSSFPMPNMSGISSPVKDKYHNVFLNIFHAFDRTGCDVIDAREVACGISILCTGYVF